jgi:hypothetical protein
MNGKDMAEVNLHEGQTAVFKDIFLNFDDTLGEDGLPLLLTMVYVVACCSRGWGKSFEMTVCAMTAVVELMELDDDVPNKNVWIIAPTYDQVTEIYWPILIMLGATEYAEKSSKSDGYLEFPGNVRLELISYESVERMRGKGAYFVGWDEVSSCHKGMPAKEAWEGIIQPCIVTRWSPKAARMHGSKRAGRLFAISTPKGYNFFYDMYNYAETDPEWKSHHFDFTQSPYLDEEQIEKLRSKMDPIRFAQEYLATFKDSGNNVFYMLDRKVHARRDLAPFRPPADDSSRDGEDVHVCIDFNVGIMAASCFALRGSQMQFLHEFKGHPDTDALGKRLQEKFRGHKIIAYPDPSGKARKSSAAVGVTDFSILQSYGIEIRARSKAPPIVDSVNAVNRLLMNANGVVSILIDPVACPGTLDSLERTSWVDRNPDLATIDKTAGVEHFSDGVRYAAEYLFPVTGGTKKTSMGRSF